MIGFLIFIVWFVSGCFLMGYSKKNITFFWVFWGWPFILLFFIIMSLHNILTDGK